MEPKRKYQVFISSTFEDLAEERKRLQETILNMNHFPVGMELFSAANDDQWTIISQTIDCSDYYVLIIGYRYGSMADEGISYTQKEYRYAKDKGIPILAFIRESGGTVPESSVETSPSKRKKLTSFIEEVKTGRLVEWWKTPDDLYTRVMNALYKQFNDTPRPGWVRADTVRFAEVQAELVQQNQRIRELEKENDQLRTQYPKRVPSIDVRINGKSSLALDLPVWYGRNTILVDYMPYDLEEKRQEGYSEEFLNEFKAFNDQLPNQEQLNQYIEARRKFDLAKNHAIPLKIDISNSGTAKATAVIVDLVFPPELRIYSKDDIEDLEEPQAPSIPMRPEFAKAFAKFGAQERLLKDYAASLKMPKLNALVAHTIDWNNHEWIEDNVLCVRRSQVMHTRCCTISDYFLVPLQVGEFKIQCTCICEELSEEQTFIIPVSVVSQ